MTRPGTNESHFWSKIRMIGYEYGFELTEECIFEVELGLCRIRDEKLACVRIRSIVGH